MIFPATRGGPLTKNVNALWALLFHFGHTLFKGMLDIAPNGATNFKNVPTKC